MFGLFKKTKNPTLSWDPKRTRRLRLDLDQFELNGVPIGCEVESASVFGNAQRFESVDKTSYVLGYPSDGFALVFSEGRLTTVDIYVTPDADDGNQACGELTIVWRTREINIPPTITPDELMDGLGDPKETGDLPEQEMVDLTWQYGNHTLSVDFVNNEIQNVELYLES